MSGLTFRALRLDRLFIAAALYLTAALLLRDPIPVPGRTLDDVVLPLLPLLLVAGYLVVERVLTTFVVEVRNPHRVRRRSWVIALAVALLVAVALASNWLGGVPVIVQVRNGLGFLGLVLLVGARNSHAALLFLVVFGAISWVLGAGGQVEPPAFWALPMAEQDSVIAGFVCLAIFAAGVLATLLRSPALKMSPSK